MSIMLNIIKASRYNGYQFITGNYGMIAKPFLWYGSPTDTNNKITISQSDPVTGHFYLYNFQLNMLYYYDGDANLISSTSVSNSFPAGGAIAKMRNRPNVFFTFANGYTFYYLDMLNTGTSGNLSAAWSTALTTAGGGGNYLGAYDEITQVLYATRSTSNKLYYGTPSSTPILLQPRGSTVAGMTGVCISHSYLFIGWNDYYISQIRLSDYTVTNILTSGTYAYGGGYGLVATSDNCVMSWENTNNEGPIQQTVISNNTESPPFGPYSCDWSQFGIGGGYFLGAWTPINTPSRLPTGIFYADNYPPYGGGAGVYLIKALTTPALTVSFSPATITSGGFSTYTITLINTTGTTLVLQHTGTTSFNGNVIISPTANTGTYTTAIAGTGKIVITSSSIQILNGALLPPGTFTIVVTVTTAGSYSPGSYVVNQPYLSYFYNSSEPTVVLGMAPTSTTITLT